ncbi:outer membrane beta-barrel family protein [Thermophagus xiamenensis]|uniref:Outer membrane receptor proteins, mostly Fe transport n=1 Tax=Thermophagus xiamenensis TaxID=385682 RepID=A0A1I2DTI6_9BACT|nr:outer membrane beta-barrel family protein [Thermophagus xiamenensis]SFE83836.1 Outer membrane receptor proteins, mostly Fe transport [Thermophagus xiamenensis]
MKKFRNFGVVYSILTLVFNSGLLAQPAPPAEKGKLTGRVIDAEENVPMEFATVSIFTLDSTLVDGGITNQNGEFSFDLKPGNYYVEIQFVAYQKETFNNIKIDNKSTVDLGSIRLKPSTTSLSEVTVTGEKSEMVIGVDRKIFNVGKDLTNTGNSAAEILDNIPTVSVDDDGNVSLRGSGGVRMLINGKPSGLVNSGTADALRSLPGNMIERVEVITNPSARYEAEGMVGIINIVLKKDQRRGVNGSFEGSIATPERYQFGANINFRREKINYFFNYGIRYGEREGEGFSDQYFPLADTPFHTRLDRNRNRSGWSHNLRGGADVYLNNTTTLTAAGMFSYDDETNKSDVLYQDFLDNNGQAGDMFEKTTRFDEEQETEWNVDFSLNLEKIFDPDNEEHKLNIYAQYMLDDETEDSDIEEKVYSSSPFNLANDSAYQTVYNNEREENYLIQADYVYPFSANGRFEAGVRGEFRDISNPYEVENLDENGDWTTDPNYTNDFSYDENVAAVYLQAANKWGPISVQAGLRGEYTGIKTHLKETGEENERSYFDLFPTVHTTYHFNQYNAWQISYSRRIDRPSFWNLNPFFGLTDSRNIRRGNPDLEPEFTDAFESGYVYTPGKSSYYAGIYYRYTSGVEERISYVTQDGITITEPRNLAERKAYGAETNISIEPLKWWNLSANFNFYRRQTEGTFIPDEGEVQDLSSDTWSWDTRINSRMQWDNNLSFQTTFFYRGEQETTQGIRKPFYMMFMSISKDVLKRNGTISLNIRDVLNSRKFRYELDQPDIISTNEFKWSSREIRLSFIYRLNQKNRPARNGSREGGGMDAGGDDMEF